MLFVHAFGDKAKCCGAHIILAVDEKSGISIALTLQQRACQLYPFFPTDLSVFLEQRGHFPIYLSNLKIDGSKHTEYGILFLYVCINQSGSYSPFCAMA